MSSIVCPDSCRHFTVRRQMQQARQADSRLAGKELADDGLQMLGKKQKPDENVLD